VKKKLIGLIVVLVLLSMIGMAQATLKVIGTGTYSGTDYNLIWDNDNNGNSVIWLDYTNAETDWQSQIDWAAGLDNQLTINWNHGISVSWNDAGWRLPATVNGAWQYSCEGTVSSATATAGYYFTNSEMGHLYYTELSKPGSTHMSGGDCQDNPAWIDNVTPPYVLQDAGSFHNLIASSWYWSGVGSSIDSANAWRFSFWDGHQDLGPKNDRDEYGLALRSGQVAFAIIYICDDNYCDNNSPCYDTIGEGYLASTNGYAIKVSTDLYIEDLIFNEDIAITLTCGWNDDYSDNAGGQSTVAGCFTITAGTVIVEGIAIEGTTYLTKTKELQFGRWQPEYWTRWASLRQ